MARILVLFAHPRPDRSIANSALLKVARSLENIELVDLYGEYPDFDIDIDREQERLTKADAIIFQHPIYWYSSPALLKEWQDLVLEYGFAFGSEGKALAGKPLLQIVTCGTARETYSPDGAYENELRTLLAPFEQTAKFCKMVYLAPYAIFSAEAIASEKRIDQCLADYRNVLTALRDGRLDLERAAAAPLLNDVLDDALLTQQGAG